MKENLLCVFSIGAGGGGLERDKSERGARQAAGEREHAGGAR